MTPGPRDASALAVTREAGAGWPGPATDGPFLSVLVRTRGDRASSLLDVMLCLSAQSDPDLEVVLAVHHPLAAELVDEVRRDVLTECPGLEARLVVVAVTEGGPSRPLNVAAEVSTGRYLAVLDDDDLVLADWVEAFREGAERAPGRVVRAVVVDQAVQWEPDPAGVRHLVAAGRHVAAYPARFSMTEHVAGGATPVHGFAFPRGVLFGLDRRFDEEMSVHEDWDFETRAVQLLGVISVERVTSVYRRHHADDSLAEHPAEVRDPFFDDLVESRLAGGVFLVDGDELLEWRRRTKLVERIWREKEEVAGELERLSQRYDQVAPVAGVLRRLPSPVRRAGRWLVARRAARRVGGI